MKEDYHLINPADSIFVATVHGEDMGVWYGHNYYLRSNIPGGEYEIYVDDTLKQRVFVAENQKERIETYYFRNGKVEHIFPYSKGEKHGEFKSFYNNGALQFKGTFVNDVGIGVHHTFFESGKIESKIYYENGVSKRREFFNESGKMIEVHDPKTGKTIKF